MKYETVVSLLICVGITVTVDVQKRSDDLSIGALEAEVGRLASQVTSLTAETTALKTQVTSQQTKIGESTFGSFVGWWLGWGGAED